jgi:hypothetical protein
VPRYVECSGRYAIYEMYAPAGSEKKGAYFAVVHGPFAWKPYMPLSRILPTKYGKPVDRLCFKGEMHPPRGTTSASKRIKDLVVAREAMRKARIEAP